MLAMRDEEALMMVAMMAFAIVVIALSLQHKARSQRIGAIEKAMTAGHLDEATRRQLLDLLAADAGRHRDLWGALSRNAGRIARVATFVVGWLTFSIGGVVLVGMLLFGGSRYDIQGATIATAIGFGLISLPLALRELEARRSA